MAVTSRRRCRTSCPSPCRACRLVSEARRYHSHRRPVSSHHSSHPHPHPHHRHSPQQQLAAAVAVTANDQLAGEVAPPVGSCNRARLAGRGQVRRGCVETASVAV